MKKIFSAFVILCFFLSACKPTEAPAPAPASIQNNLQSAAKGSSCAAVNWNKRGTAPTGYIQGMALVFARDYCKLKKADPLAVLMAQARKTPEATADATDVLSWYHSNFAKAGLSNDTAGPDTLRHLFTLGIALGMQESSGNHYEGRDMSASNTSSLTAEAGLFQTSWNAAPFVPGAANLMASYKIGDAKCLLDVFHLGLSTKNSSNYGSGAGADFQALAKSCPTFAAEFAMATLRNLRRHYGPINLKTAEIRTECDSMLKGIQAQVDAAPSYCNSL